MKKDCRNDCLEALRFPRTIENRPGLSRLDYRIGTYADIREALLRNLDKTPGLAHWTHRGADDPGIALLEGASILGDILTFYQQHYANEAYLRTAQWRESISELVRLLGYRLSPGLGGRAVFAFEVKGDQPVVIPPAFPLKADIEGVPAPVDFETVAPASNATQTLAYPWLSKFNLFAPLETPLQITANTNSFYIQTPNQLTATTPVVLKAGDRLLVGELHSNASLNRLNNAEIVIVDSVTELHGIKTFKIKGKLKRSGSVGQLAAYKIGRSFHHFGHNGPRTFLKPVDPITSTATENDDGSTTVETQSPLEIKISFRRDLSTSNSSEDVNDYIVAPRARARSGPVIDSTGAVVEGAMGGGSSSPVIDYSDPGSYYLGGSAGGFGGSYGGYAGSFPGSYPGGIGSVVWSDAGFIGYVDVGTQYYYAGEPVVMVDPTLAKTDFPLDAEVQDLATGVTLIIQGQFYASKTDTTANEVVLMRDISNLKTTSVTWGLTTGTVTMVTVGQALDVATSDNEFMDISQVQFHETLSPQLTLRAAMIPNTPAIHDTLNFYGTADQAQNLMGRDLFFVKESGEPLRVTVTSVDPASAVDGTHPLLHKITLNYNSLNYADFPNDPPFKVTVYGNIVEATQGKTEKLAPLGNGDSRLVFQTFKLPKAPLTYLRSSSATPPEVPELLIYVNNRLWKRVASFFDRGPDEEIYIVREDADSVSWVQFGDGKTGARVPSGVKNVSAVYRSGSGAFGPLKEKAKVQAGAKLDRLDKIQMPKPASDGGPPEDGENARAAGPGKIQSLDRLVSLQDFESEALAIPGITKAAAAWQLVGGIPQVTLTVLMETGRPETLQDLRATFAKANGDRGPSRFPIQPILGQRKYVAIRATFGYDSTYLAEDVQKEIQKALGAAAERLACWMWPPACSVYATGDSDKGNTPPPWPV